MTIIQMILYFMATVIVIQVVSNILIWRQVRSTDKFVREIKKERDNENGKVKRRARN